MTTPTYTEGTGFPLRINFRDPNNQPTTPSTVQYRIDCRTTNRTVRDWTSVTPSPQLDIAVTPQDNAILNDHNSKELKLMTVVADRGLATQFVDQQDWNVINVPANRNIIP
jgi:hypothetical protein